MNLANAPAAYEAKDQDRVREELRKADAQNLKRGGDVVFRGGRLIITDTVTGAQYKAQMASGVFSWVAI